MRLINTVPALLIPAQMVGAFAPYTTPNRFVRSSIILDGTDKVLNDLDIMCIMNAADLCSFHDECDIEEREALLNRLDEQTNLLAERIAMISCLNTHLKTGDHKHLEEEEASKLTEKILELVEPVTSLS
mmetsp:Transcript_9885/g.11563  ORF Transcript_9885/g.11563 Transcript_9885/m.11563 type:complete len:129 (+) Transcript_9885:95-481(+)|eukprot:CAMPEP_0198254026 /NCGR_PEP_ID=MMETSP1447-20131203/4408_1 /TAXON_ID=420782 /ORGANISM="Chaetoceros dichaeta, Strain CCMP1751" /LENGTH=128 /DNA_ID=CAMNT_0043939933 /DNA_START=91 /DNA_END=477 /DNA_ORIENTATION=+